MPRLTITEAPPCDVAYLTEGAQIYAKITKTDFEKILNERRRAICLSKLWLCLALAAAVMLAGTAYWVTEHPATKVVMVAPANSK